MNPLCPKGRLANAILVLLGAGVFPCLADVPGVINYQGRVVVNGTNFDGTGQFKFALVNDAGTVNFWSNDGTGSGQPGSAVSVAVTKGLYSVLLGQSPNPPIPPSVFTNSTVSLRIWFSDGVSGFSQLSPDQRIGSVGYAFYATVAGSVQSAGDISGARLNIGGGNTLDGIQATIAGGSNNTASGYISSVGGGIGNTAGGNYAAVGGGAFNNASGAGASVSGGGTDGSTFAGNSATGSASTVSGGLGNTAGAYATTVAGGQNNVASKGHAAVGGGVGNTAAGGSAVVGGGYANSATGDQAVVSGGGANIAGGVQSVVSGGFTNRALGDGSMIGGGSENVASGPKSAVLGGHHNVASNWYATVAGGFFNTAGGLDSFAAGTTAKALHDGTFVWADYSSLNDFASTTNNQFLIRAAHGVGIGTTNPTEQLDVAGAVRIGNTANPTPAAGTIRWTGAGFEGFDGQRWGSLSLQPPPGFVLVPAGTFTMGSDAVGGSAVPEHQVTLSSFYLAKYEVTYALWWSVKQWALTNGYYFENPGREGHNGNYPYGETPTDDSGKPVTVISWRDCIVWCNARSEKEGFAPVYTYTNGVIRDSRDANATACDNALFNRDGNGYRLPTESEWEYAARYIDGISQTPGNFASGAGAPHNNTNASVEVSWYAVNSIFGEYEYGSESYGPHPVGTKPPNQLGIYDMSGNVDEWCWDWYAAYSSGSLTNPIGPSTGSERTIGYGDWNVSSPGIQCSYRIAFGPTWDGNGHCGFRLARNVP